MTVRLGLGLTTFPFEQPRYFFDWAELCEERGIDSLWQSDRLISEQSYLECLSTLASLAGITQRLRFGMNVVVTPLRDPLVLAKQCATIDFLSNGRLLPMFGVGRNTAPEWQATGRDDTLRKVRGKRTNEILQLLHHLWNEEQVTFIGEHFQYHNATIAPRPIQQPLPLWIGGHSQAAVKRTALYGSGWIGGISSVAQVGETISAIRHQLTQTQRQIDDDHYGATIAFRIGAWDDPAVQNYPLLRRPDLKAELEKLHTLLCVGSAEDLIQRLQEFIAVGATKFVLFPIAEGKADVFMQTQRLIEDVIPVVETTD